MEMGVSSMEMGSFSGGVFDVFDDATFEGR
jgi:hypothetical protein